MEREQTMPWVWVQYYRVGHLIVVLECLLLVYLVTALVPSETACLASSPGSSRRTAVWISREVMVDLKELVIGSPKKAISNGLASCCSG